MRGKCIYLNLKQSKRIKQNFLVLHYCKIHFFLYCMFKKKHQLYTASNIEINIVVIIMAIYVYQISIFDSICPCLVKPSCLEE